MSEFLNLAFPLAAGLLLGGIFFGGLWSTVRQGVASKSPALLFVASLLLRMCLTLSGFYFVGRGDWKRMVSCLLGFIAARFIVVRCTYTSDAPTDAVAEEASDAP